MFRFAIMGLGKIARKFATDLKLVEGATLESVASRSQSRANDFAEEFGARYACGSYEDLFEGPYLHCVYIATPHPSHAELVELCIEHGVGVLCEKPLAMNYAEVSRLVGLARRRHVYLLEAIWTRFLPTFLAAKRRLDDGAIGEIEGLRADLGFKLHDGHSPRITDRALGAGALLDIGIYPVFLAQVLFGAPEEITAVGRLDEHGVDVDDTIVLRYAGGRLATLHCTLLARTKTEAVVYGSRGTLFWDELWYQQSNFTIRPDDGEEERRYVTKAKGFGYHFEAQAVVDDLRDKRTENALWTLDDSLELHRTLTTIRERLGVRYPADEDATASDDGGDDPVDGARRVDSRL